MPSSIELNFGDGLYTFALPVPHIEEIQRKCGAGIGTIFGRVLKGCERAGDEIVLAPAFAEFYVRDIIETLRHGLIGGGKGIVDGAEVVVTPSLANTLITTYVADRPLAGSWSIAASVLAATIVGYDPPKKDGPPEGAAAAGQEATAG